jgi:hypothetical protein
MKTGAQIGVAVAAGYVLGRFHKMKWALALATMAGRKRLANQGMLRQGAKLLSSSPELSKLTDEVRGSLVEAGKTAAVAAVGSRINSLSEGLRERSESMRAPDLPKAGSKPDDDSGQEDEEDGRGDEDSGGEAKEPAKPRASKRPRPEGGQRASRSAGRSAPRRESGEDSPRPKRRRPADGSDGQRGKRRRETADE